MKLILADFFSRHKEDICNRWLELFWKKFGVAEPYLRREFDQFTNPFSYHINECFTKIVESLSREFTYEELDPYLEKIAQIRATQESSLSRALYFLIDLKSLIRERWGDFITKEYGLSAWLEFEDLLDALFMRLSDYFVKYRDRLWEVRIYEWKKNHYLLLKRAGLLADEELVNEEIKN